MKWQGRRGSGNIEDRRSASGSGARGGSATATGGGAAVVLVVVVVGYFLGIDVTPLLQGVSAPATGNGSALTRADRDAAAFVSVTLADTEEVWTGIFRSDLGQTYTPPVLVLFSGNTNSPCGGASGASGPFYCPSDQKAYLDTDFFATLSHELGAKGDFAAAYVVAHEVAHHVQNELGILGEANRVRQQVSPAESNQISVRIELQADCFSGIWARRAQQQFGALEPGDVAEAMNAAKRIGDDTLQKAAGRAPNPHTYTHGTSAQRVAWFVRGYKSAALADCDTFAATRL